jgi:hypothetical protein
MAKKKKSSSAFLEVGLRGNVPGLKAPDSVLPLLPNMLRCTLEVSGPKIDKMEFVVQDLLLIWMSSHKTSQPLLCNPALRQPHEIFFKNFAWNHLDYCDNAIVLRHSHRADPTRHRSIASIRAERKVSG